MEDNDKNSHQNSGGITDIASVVSSTRQIQAVTSSEHTAIINVTDSPLQPPIEVVSITQQMPSKTSSDKNKVSSNQLKTEIWTAIPSVTKKPPQNVILGQVISTTQSNTKDSDLIARLSSPVGPNVQMSGSMPPDSVHNYAMAVTTSASPSGSTIHHLSQTPPRPMHTQPIKASPTHAGGMPKTPTSLSVAVDSSSVPCLGYSLSASGSSSLSTSPRQKRIKLEEKPVLTEELLNLRKSIYEFKYRHYVKNKENYREHACELFFLQNGGNMMDYASWKKRPSPHLLKFLKENSVDSDEDEEQIGHPEVKVPALGGTPVAVSTTLPAAVTLLSQGGTPLLLDSTGVSASNGAGQINRFSTPQSSENKLSTTPRTSVHSAKSPKLLTASIAPSPNVTPNSRSSLKQQSLSAVYDSSIGSQEQIVERAKQEAYVMQRVSELRKEGLWSSKRLPKVQEPPRAKAHWDYLLEEMVWLATDFAQERKWKKAVAKKCARMVVKRLHEKKSKEERAEKDEALKLRKIANFYSKEIKQFWSNIEKVAEYKQQSILDERRKKALDIHLNFIVDQTEKYSSWLTRGLSQSVAAGNSRANSVRSGSIRTSNQSRESSPVSPRVQEDKKPGCNRTATHSDNAECIDAENSGTKSCVESVEDNEYKADDDGADDEATLDEEENKEKNIDHAAEIQDLENEGNIPIEELYKKYAAAYDSDFEMPESEGLDSDDDSTEEENDSEDDSDDEMEVSDQEASGDEAKEIGVEFLINSEATDASKSEDVEKSAVPSKEISDIAATAESFQPKGYTLSTAQVCTKVPFLLKHQLREYQHIGLEWLVAMNDKKLNGILADEMGLGKTIQTIALLAHLACEKGNWGPHLIVVPTSVMLNWEMEFKKWSPAFKILTYYGSIKERKKKREGWTKPNAFHVCITSYKLVVQDHQSFRRKKWKYLILDEAQNIKNFKSQRWQYLLNFVTTRRLLLTGTPLQNSLMELWSLMHFLMPNVFSSHKEFKEWFSNPMSGMIEGSHEYNDGLIKRLHKVLRPFLLRRLKSEVEKQLPSKFEHVVMCRLSKRQRFLYDDFMSRTKTKETLASGNFLSVINVLMQLRKVCNHPNMFEQRPIHSPFYMEGISFQTASIVLRALEYDPLKHINLWTLNLLLTNLELTLTAFAAHRIRKFQRSQKLIEEIDSQPDPPPKCPPGKIRLHIRSTQPGSNTGRMSPHPSSLQPQKAMSPASVAIRPSLASVNLSNQTTLKNVISQAAGMSATPMTFNSSAGPITVQIQQTQQGPRLTLPAGNMSQLPGYAQLVQTSSGQHILLTTSATAAQLLQQAQAQVQQQQPLSSQSTATTTNSTTTITTSSMQQSSLLASQPTPAASAVNATTTTSMANNSTQVSSSNSVKLPYSNINTSKPVVKVAPLNVTTATPSSTTVPVPSVKPVLETDIVKTTPSSISPRKIKVKDLDPDIKSLFDMSSLSKMKTQIRKERLSILGRINKRRCEACPLYGSDLIQAVNIREDTNPIRAPAKLTRPWKGMGFIHCINASRSEMDSRRYSNYTSTLFDIVDTPENCLNKLKNIIDKFVFLVPPARAPSIQLHVSHPPPSFSWNEARMNSMISEYVNPKTAFLHPISSSMLTQFPDRRLIQYDCGKLQILDKLLRQLKSGQHRVLIFTQMTRMLDILESFLNFHGHIYLRLDGATRVDQRQALMERFNADKRIFVFILSTRSGGIGVNLTGADTVIFYDSDWNPTMDAQAQDRCHRIGQTRDVHIYRLISEKTIEENILKKANQKRLLGNIAIEGGNFTTAFFKENALNELFGEKDPGSLGKKAVTIAKDGSETACTQGQLEQALCQAEEESDVTAAKTAKAEAAAELAEFDESIPYDGDSKPDEPSQVEEEIEQLMGQLSPVERYALKFLESIQEPFSSELIKQAEEEIEAQKNNWELGRLQALKEEEERRAELEDESLPYFTYSREEAQTQVYVSRTNQEEIMPVWYPPTPPQDENDIYIDYSLAMIYDHSVMSETDLPPIYVKRDSRRIKIDAVTAARKQKPRVKEDFVPIPRSLFDRPTAALLKMRREAKLQKTRGNFRPFNVKPPSLLPLKPVVEASNDGPEWLIQEDWQLLQTLQVLQELPLSLTVLSPAQIPNWDLSSDMVNKVSRIYRSPKQCKARYESVIIPREEGRAMFDANSKKQKTKTKSLYKTKNNRPMKTSQLYAQDKNGQSLALVKARFEAILQIASNRTPTHKPTLTNPTIDNPSHTAEIAKHGITYDQPMSPVRLAALRAERIAQEKQEKEKLKSLQNASTGTASQQHVANQRAQALIQSQVAPKTVATVKTPQSVVSKTIPAAGLTPVTLNTTVAAVSPTVSAPNVAVASPSYTATLSKGLVVSHQNTLTPLTSIRTVPSTSASISDQVAHTVRRAISNSANSLSSAGTTQAGTVVSVANITQAQQAQRISGNLNVVTTATVIGQQATMTTATAKQISPTDIHLYRQTALIRHQRLQQAQEQVKQQQLKRMQATQVQATQVQAGSIVQPARISVAVSSATTTTGTVQVQVAAAQIAQQRIVQQMAAKQQVVGMAGKQTITRTMTEAEMTQLLKRQQLQKASGTVGSVSLSTAQLLAAQANLQQGNSSTHLQQAQTPTVATLVKTVSAPGSLGTGSSVTIPVSAVNVGGVKLAGGTGKVTTVSPQQQLRQIQLQQQLIQQQRKIQLHNQQQKVVSSLAQVTKMGGKTAIPTQLSAVQIVQGQAGALASGSRQVVTAAQAGSSKQLPATVTVQQIHHVIKQVQQQHQQAQAAQQASSGGSFVPVTTSISNPTIAVVSSSNLPHQLVQKAILAKPVSQTSTASIQNIVPVVTTAATQLQARVIPSLSSSGVGKPTIQLLTGVHTLRPQSASVTSVMTPKIITTQGLGTSTAMVKAIPSILQSVVTSPSVMKTDSTEKKAEPSTAPIVTLPISNEPVTTQAFTKLIPTSSIETFLQNTFIPVSNSAMSSQSLNPSSTVNTAVTTTSMATGNLPTVCTTIEDEHVEVTNELDDTNVDVVDDSNDDSNSKDPNVTRSSPYPMRLRNPPKL